MRRNSVRKFIHAILDLLPLFVIPIFALNILHKEVEPISIEVQEKESFNFNQYVQNDKINFTNTITDNRDYLNFVIALYENTTYKTWIRGSHINTDNYTYEYIFTLPTISTQNNITLFHSGAERNIDFANAYFHLISGHKIYVKANVLAYNIKVVGGCNIENIQVYDLTKMYGSGNEPSITEFNSQFNAPFYNYTEGTKILVNKPSPTTYNDTDIGSQFVYALYKPVNDYFNFNNLFNMGAIYDWIQLNLFSGTAPLPVFIIWNIIVYEFFVDLIFLFYSVFIFIIDFAEKCLERPFGR